MLYSPALRPARAVVIGGTKNFNFDQISAAQPDLIIGNKEENYQEGIMQLQQHYPVWMSDISNLPEALLMINQVGQLTGKTHLAEPLAAGNRPHLCRPTPTGSSYSDRLFYLAQAVHGGGRRHGLLLICWRGRVFATYSRTLTATPK
ncbi:MAG: helical backbone metal receptor [Hymenobacter sp.]